MTDKDKTFVVPLSATRRTEHDGDAVEVGQWYWVDMSGDEDEKKPQPWLMCIVRVGSNFVKLQSVGGTSRRVHADDFHDTCTYEPDPDPVIQRRISVCQTEVKRLMDKVQQVCALLGIVPRVQLGETLSEESKALATVSGTADPQAHKKALVKAKEETLPELFKQIEEEHGKATRWMKARVIPMKARSSNMEQSISVIEDRIFAVELYAGLVEDLAQVKKGKSASIDAKVHVFQGRHYMDEECLVNYKAGGMEFKDIRAFDRWLCRKENLDRILPFPRTVVAFKIRRKKKEREEYTLSDYITISRKVMQDKKTVLYIRNGQQVFRLMTEIEFGESLFPDQQYELALNQSSPMWGRMWSEGDLQELITDADYQARVAKYERKRTEHKAEMMEWMRTPKKDRSYFKPSFYSSFKREDWHACNPDDVYYDDIMQGIANNIRNHNRIVVLLQGLLDRSMAFHPHPPWQLWTGEGVTSAIELVYDASRALTDGDPPDFEEYRSGLNLTLGRGCFTVGQQVFWEMYEAEKEHDRVNLRRRWCDRYPSYRKRYKPYGNPGPGVVAEVMRFGRKYQCSFAWMRKRQTYDPWGERKGDIRTTFTCPSNKLLNVSAYKPGDFKRFYNDPRTRADYLKWAPLLLAAEDWHAAQKKKREKK